MIMEGKSVKSGMSAYELDLCAAAAVVQPQKSDESQKSVYACTCCGNKLFDPASEYQYNEKYPRIPDVLEFTGIVAKENVTLADENVYGIERVSFVCKKCGLNLGFIATRGEENNIIYCANSLCIKLVDKNEKVIAGDDDDDDDKNGWVPTIDVMESVYKVEEPIKEVEKKKKEEVEKEEKEKEEEKKKKKEKEKKGKNSEKSQISIPRVAAALAGLLSVVGWAGFTTK